MVMQKTDKTILSGDDILKYIQDYENNTVPHLDELWKYYKGKDPFILKRQTPDPNNPDNKIVVSYGRKIINTYTGYAYRPKYITYKCNEKDDEKSDGEESNPTQLENDETVEEQFIHELKNIFSTNKEHIKTNRAGRNSAIFGVAYEICYIDSEIQILDNKLPVKALPKFFTVDPRQMIVLYDYSPEPKIVCAIRYYKMGNDDTYKVEVYYSNSIVTYTRIQSGNGKWLLNFENERPNFFGEVPVIAYYMGDEMQSLMECVLTLIDAHDVLFSDSMNEFDRFAFAYLVMKKFGLTNPIDKKDPSKVSFALQLLKRRRVFENLDEKADIKFLTKDIPTQFITLIGQQLRDQIHIQSHVPDFTSPTMTGASGIAIQRLMFDFENLVSSAEADFDVGLNKRIDLMAKIMRDLKIADGDSSMVTISHKRNVPLNINDFATAALTMSSAGFSRRAIVGIMPEDIIPNLEKELEYEKEEQMGMTNGLDMYGSEDQLPEDQAQVDDLTAENASTTNQENM